MLVPEKARRLALAFLALWVFALGVLRILSFGFLPPDDVLRHSAYAVGHRTWGQILIGRPEALFDQAPGWHALLRGLHGLFGWGPEALATFSIAFCLMVFLASGLLWVRRWETWVLALALCFLCDGDLILRMALGRPFVLTSALLVILMGSLRSELSWRSQALLWGLGAALATWVHGSWYLLFLLPLSVFLVGRFKAAMRLALMVALGCLVGAALTGHPVAYLEGQCGHLVHALGRKAYPGSLAMEFMPGHQTLLLPLLVLVVAGLDWRKHGLRFLRDPLLLLGLLTWVLGFFCVWRFYLDWAFPALALWVALRLDENTDPLWIGLRRYGWAGVTAVLFLVGVGMNRHGRWSENGRINGLSPDRPMEKAFLPRPGGVLYSNSMFVFYGTYFQNPNGDWKYVLGFEPGLMKEEDDRVYQESFRTQDWDQALAPWVGRMTSRDRMVLLGPPQAPPAVQGLAWVFVAPNKWVGLKPTPPAVPARPAT